MKRIISILLTLSIMISAIANFGITANAAYAEIDWESTAYIDGIKFRLIQYESVPGGAREDEIMVFQNTAILLNAKESAVPDGVLTVPATVTYEGETYFVTRCEFETKIDEDNGWVTWESDEDEQLYKYCKKMILPDTIDYLNLNVFGTPEHPLEVVLGNYVRVINKHYRLKGETENYNNMEYITFNTERSMNFRVENNLLIGGYKTIYGVFGEFGGYEIPSHTTYISHLAFSQCNRLYAIIIPKEITSVGASAFYGCENLVSISIQSRDEPIWFEGTPFDGCNNVKKFTVPGKISESGWGLCYGMKGLKEVKFAKKYANKILPGLTFAECESLEKITLPKSLTTIEDRVFKNCKSLKKINIPKKVTSIGEKLFYGCTDLETVNLYGNIKTVSRSAFTRCTDLETVNFKGKYLEKFEDYAFYKNTSLKKITISNTKNAPKFTKKTFRGAKKGIKFYVKNKTVAKKLKANLKRVGYTSAKIYADGKRYK